MSIIKIGKETAVPSGAGIVANTIYVVSVSTDIIEIYMSNNAGTALKRLLNEVDIQALIDASLSGVSSIEVVNDITARDSLSPTTNTEVFVLDATGDSTVASGGANYIFRVSDSTWYKQSEAESMDVTLNWASILGKPTSSPAQIDQAVSDSHTHLNKTEIDLIGQDADGDATYNGSKIANEYTSTDW